MKTQETVQNGILKVMANTDVFVSIGRNIRNSPMAASSWDRFKASLMQTIDMPHAEIHFTGTGTGWDNDNSGEEHFFIVFTTTSKHLEAVEKLLPLLAERYEQKSIALTVGKTKMMRGR